MLISCLPRVVLYAVSNVPHWLYGVHNHKMRTFDMMTAIRINEFPEMVQSQSGLLKSSVEALDINSRLLSI